MRPFAAQGFGDQKAFGLRVVQAGRVKLVELQIRHSAARAPGHGNTIATGAIRVAGIEVDLGGSAGRQNGEARPERVDFPGAAIEYIGAKAAIALQAQSALGDQVHRYPLFEQLNVGPLLCLFEQGFENGRASGIGGVDDAPMTVPAFTGEVKLKTGMLRVGRFIAGEGHALIDQPLNGFAAVFDGETHGVFMTQPATGVKRVFDMGLNGVGIIQHGGHATLCPERRAIGQIALTQDCNAQMAGQGKREAQTGSAAANHQHIMLKMLAHSSDVRKKSAH